MAMWYCIRCHAVTLKQKATILFDARLSLRRSKHNRQVWNWFQPGVSAMPVNSPKICSLWTPLKMWMSIGSLSYPIWTIVLHVAPSRSTPAGGEEERVLALLPRLARAFRRERSRTFAAVRRREDDCALPPLAS
jgi:hypothetical protein